jgi:hypothetical protein
MLDGRSRLGGGDAVHNARRFRLAAQGCSCTFCPVYGMAAVPQMLEVVSPVWRPNLAYRAALK